MAQVRPATVCFSGRSSYRAGLPQIHHKGIQEYHGNCHRAGARARPQDRGAQGPRGARAGAPGEPRAQARALVPVGPAGTRAGGLPRGLRAAPPRPGRRHTRPDPGRACPQHADGGGLAPFPPAARGVSGRRQPLAGLEQPLDRRGGPPRPGAARLLPRHPPVRSAQDRGDAVRAASIPSGTRTRIGSSPTPRYRSAPPSSRTPRPAASSASTSRAWPRC